MARRSKNECINTMTDIHRRVIVELNFDETLVPQDDSEGMIAPAGEWTREGLERELERVWGENQSRMSMENLRITVLMLI